MESRQKRQQQQVDTMERVSAFFNYYNPITLYNSLVGTKNDVQNPTPLGQLLLTSNNYFSLFARYLPPKDLGRLNQVSKRSNNLGKEFQKNLLNSQILHTLNMIQTQNSLHYFFPVTMACLITQKRKKFCRQQLANRIV